MTETADRQLQSRVAALVARMAAAPGASRKDFDWSRPTTLPAWLPRRHATAAVSQFLLGEMATARMCAALRRRMALPAASDFLDLQAADERRHADIYRAYLDKIGGPARRTPAIARTFEAAMAWSGPPEGMILAFHAVLEGESLRLQRIVGKWMPCPLFRDIGVAIARDEARHIAFGRLYLRTALPQLPMRQRLALFRWVRDLWFGAVRDAVAEFAPPGLFRAGGGWRHWVTAEWRERLDELQALGLFSPAEREAFDTA